MICETCRWSGRPGFVQTTHARERALSDEQHGFVPCPDCGGQGIAHCCDGICEQPQSVSFHNGTT
jgi:hypothetical protein